jgi:hypothetical protein
MVRSHRLLSLVLTGRHQSLSNGRLKKYTRCETKEKRKRAAKTTPPCGGLRLTLRFDVVSHQ